ncbi:MAG: hypothetical protein ACOX4D_00415 [Bacteroidales bacterium]|jgi:hypothetical protein
MKKVFYKTILFSIALIVVGCKGTIEDRENFIGTYKGTYHGYKKLSITLVPTEDHISGEETFVIIAGEDDTSVILYMEEDTIYGNVVGNRVKFDPYYRTTQDSLYLINEEYKMDAKLKKGGKFIYSTIITGSLTDENGYPYPLDGFIEGEAFKQ